MGHNMKYNISYNQAYVRLSSVLCFCADGSRREMPTLPKSPEPSVGVPGAEPGNRHSAAVSCEYRSSTMQQNHSSAPEKTHPLLMCAL